MRRVSWHAVGAIVLALIMGPVPGQPDPNKPVTAVTFREAATAFAGAVAKEVGPDAELTYRTKIPGGACRVGYQPVGDIYTALKEQVKSITWDKKQVPNLVGDEQLAAEVVDAKGRVFRFAVSPDKRRHPKNPGQPQYALRCASPTLKADYEVLDQAEVAQWLALPIKYSSRGGVMINEPATGQPATEKKSKIDVAGFGTVKIYKRLVNEKGEVTDDLDPEPLAMGERHVEISPRIRGWRYRCEALKPETTFEVALANTQPHAWAIDVLLDGRSSTEGAGKYRGAKYILPPQKGKEPTECFIRGWLKEPKGAKGADNFQEFEYTTFIVKNVPDSDPELTKLTTESRSTIEIVWYGAWETGTARPASLPHPQSGSTDIVGSGKHGTQNLKVVTYDVDKKALGSVVIEFGDRAE